MSDLKKSGLGKASRPALGAAFGLSLLALSPSILPQTALAQSPRPVVVELFTSQGCSSCPPADAFLGDLAKRPDVIALAWHVDYWNYLGWQDPFSSEEATNRQRVYGRQLGLPYVYTPQMVVDGQFDERGFDRAGVRRRIEDQTAEGAAAPLVQAKLTRTDETLTASLDSTDPVAEAMVLLVVFDREHQTEVKRGENAGKRLSDFNIVRKVISLGLYEGGQKNFAIPGETVGAGQGAALLVQSGKQGRYLGATQLLPGAV